MAGSSIDAMSPELFKRLLKRERLARKAAEQLLDQKSIELYDTNEELKRVTEDLEKRFNQRNADLVAERNRAIEAMDALRESQQRFLDVANVVGEYVWELDARFCFTFLSAQVESVLGYAADELLGCMIFEYMNADDAADMKYSLEKAARCETNFSNLTHQACSKSGERIWLRSAGKPSYDAFGSLIGYRGASLDIRELKSQEREIEIALEQAKAGAEAKSVFLANMSHEIRTPLNGICGMAHLLMNAPLSGEERECVRSIQASGETLLRVISDILDFSKIEAGRLEIEKVDFDLAKSMDVVQSILKSVARERGLRFDVVYPDGSIPMLNGDSGRLTEVLLNLLGNALKFTSEGGVSLECRIVEKSEATVTVQFVVADSGIGMSEADLSRVFKPFGQADASISRRFGGTGLGLSISRDLVRLMGGTLSVDSVLGEGSEFVVEIPFSPSQSTAQVFPQLEAVEVFILTESMVFYRSVESMLSPLNLACVQVSSLEEAAKQFVRFQGDRRALLIVDCVDDSRFEFSKAGVLPSGVACLQVGAVGSSESVRGRMHGILYPISRYKLIVQMFDLMGLEVPVGIHDQFDISSKGSVLDLDGFRVLLAEDNHINQKVARMTLERFNAAVDVAGNGFEAVQMAQSFQYDLILMDVRMPEMDGLEACRQIRASGSRVPIVALTADAMKGDREHFIDSGMDGYLSKPLVEADLVDLLSRAHSGRMELNERALEPEADAPAEHMEVLDRIKGLIAEEVDFDAEALYGLLGGDKEFSHSILAQFQEMAVDAREEAIKLLDEGDVDRARSRCHKIAGSAATVFANRVRVCFIHCERLLREDSPAVDACRALLVLAGDSLDATGEIIKSMDLSE